MFRGVDSHSYIFFIFVIGHGLAVVAVILVQCCIDMWHTGVRLYKVDWEQKNREERLRILHIEGALVVKNVAGNTFRGSVALVGACVGASVGSVVWVGTGTWVGKCFILLFLSFRFCCLYHFVFVVMCCFR